MAKINTYTTVTPSLSDKVIGTDASNDSTTNNFLISDIVGLIPSTTTTVTPALDDKATILDTSDGSKLKNATLQSIKDLFGGGGVNILQYTPTIIAGTNSNTTGTGPSNGFYVQLGNYVLFSTISSINALASGNNPANIIKYDVTLPIATASSDDNDLIVSTDNLINVNHCYSTLSTAFSPRRMRINLSVAQSNTVYTVQTVGIYKIV